ncbi:hypothetical protein [Georgenia thermotolerans]|uniref:hypothetical protein n=1 Tax=Georgenia thermotolerans TaxID=527326 RepID=UPI00186B2975|nr:hypothetical protein [Georgenia thermotolerans]
MNDFTPPEPRPIGAIIGPDPAAWLAKVMGLPRDYVAAKLAQANATLKDAA